MTRKQTITAIVAGLVGACVIAYALIPGMASAVPTNTSCTGAGCFVDAIGDLRTNTGAATDALEAEVCASTASAALPAGAQLAQAKSLYIQNRSSATCYVSLDAVSVTTAGATGWKFASGDERSWDIDGSVFGSAIRVACTANQTTGACLFFGWLK